MTLSYPGYRVAGADATGQRACVAGLERYLSRTPASGLAPFFSSTLQGTLRCDADAGFAHVPTRSIVTWLSHATGRTDARVRIPPQPAFLAVIPGNDPARANYQRRCTAWIATVLPLQIARQGDDPDTAAAHVFDAIEECDGAAGLGTIPRERLVAIMRAKHLL